MTTEIKIEAGYFEESQLLNIENVGRIYEIIKVTLKAICIEVPSRGFLPDSKGNSLWLPISQLSKCTVNANPDNSTHGIHNVSVSKWLERENSKKW